MNQTTEEILRIFESHRMAPTADDMYMTQGRTLLQKKIDSFVANRRPVTFFMLGYPFKSQNDRDKVLGKAPDRMEYASLSNFKTFDNEVKQVYSPGVHYALVSDGHVFGDVLRIEESVIEDYAGQCRDIAASVGLPVTWYSIRDFYPKGLTIPAIVEKLMQQFGVSPTELQRRITFIPDTNKLYTGMIHFMEGDIALWGFPSKNQLNKQAKIIAREMMSRNEAYGALTLTNFPDYIKLSMHPSQNNGEKYSFQLIPSPTAKHSPWHGAFVVNKDGSFTTMHKKEALASGHEIVNVNGKPYYMQEV